MILLPFLGNDNQAAFLILVDFYPSGTSIQLFNESHGCTLIQRDLLSYC
jgi:hypothetical protein